MNPVTKVQKLIAARVLQSLAVARGDPSIPLAYAASQGHWAQKNEIQRALMAIVSPLDTSGYPASLVPVADSFLAAQRDSSIPERLQGLRPVAMLTRVFISNTPTTGTQIAEGASIGVTKGDFSTTILEPMKHAAIVVQNSEFARSTSPTAAVAILTDLAEAVSEVENRHFVSPYETDSVLNGQTEIISAGSSLASIDTDLAAIIDAVPGADRAGVTWTMTKQTATFLSLVRGSAGARAYPNISPKGGTLLDFPVLITKACEQPGSPVTRIIGLIDPNQIYWAEDQRVELSASTAAALQQDDAPTGAPGSVVSMYQTDSIATRAIKTSSWFARAGAGAYAVVGY